VKGTFADLEECGAIVVAIGSLLVLGEAAAEFASAKNVALVSLAAMENRIWTAATCPLCAEGLPLQDVADFLGLLRGFGPHKAAKSRA
jgi:hypothetical protein